MESSDIQSFSGQALNARMLDALLAASPDNVYLSDRAGRYLYASPAGAKALGFARADIVGKTLSDLSITSELAGRLETERHHVLTTGQSVQGMITFPTATGSHIFEYTYSPVLTEANTVEAVLCVARDVTERENAYQARERAQEEHAALLQEMRYVTTHAKCLLWHGSATLYKDDGIYWDTVVFDEAAAQAFLPLSILPGERYTNAWYRHRLPEWKVVTDQAASEAFQSGQAYYHTEFACQSSAGAIRWFDEQVYLEPLALPPSDSPDFDPRKSALWRVVGVCADITERRNAEEERQDVMRRQRNFLRDVLASVTEGKLRLCDTKRDLPAPLAAIGDWIELSLTEGLGELRQQTARAAQANGFSEERWRDLITAVGEVAMNAIVHAGGGQGLVCAGRNQTNQTVQVWIVDEGQGIAVEYLPHATLQKGFTTAGTLGHGMKMMLETADRVWLLTGPTGTTVVLEQDALAPALEWLWSLAPEKSRQISDGMHLS